jgi:hypothetical protein
MALTLEETDELLQLARYSPLLEVKAPSVSAAAADGRAVPAP